MGKEYRAKVFKSGNSLALRLPKELGMKEGATLVLREERAGFTAKPAEPPRRTIDVGSFWGMAKGMVHTPEPREDFELRPSAVPARP